MTAKTFATLPFNTHAQERDVVVLRDYTGDKNQLTYKRTAPKRVKDFPGMEKTELKHTMTDASGNIIGIQTVSTSIIATASAADRQALLAVTAAAVADEAYVSLVNDQRLPLAV